MIPTSDKKTKRLSPPRFVADAMLGRLAKWLRLMGYDVTYFHNADDISLLRHARADGRLLLTRDKALAHQARELGVLLTTQHLEEQLRELARLNLITGPLKETRCPICNVPLRRVEKEAVRLRVPPYVYQTQEEFYECPQCHRIYWEGSHWQNVQATWHTLGWYEEE